MAKKKKVRVDLRKNRTKPPREQQWTRGFQEHGFAEEATTQDERVRAKGDCRADGRSSGRDRQPAEGDGAGRDAGRRRRRTCPGRVLRVFRDVCERVRRRTAGQFRCAVRRLLRSLTHRRAQHRHHRRPRLVAPGEQTSGNVEATPRASSSASSRGTAC